MTGYVNYRAKFLLGVSGEKAAELKQEKSCILSMVRVYYEIYLGVKGDLVTWPFE